MPKQNPRYLRDALARCRARETAPTRRYPASVRHQATVHALRRRSAGVPLRLIASELGMSLATVQRWLGGPVRGPFRRVEVGPTAPLRRSPAAERRIVFFSPRGYRVEGLDVEELTELLRALA